MRHAQWLLACLALSIGCTQAARSADATQQPLIAAAQAEQDAMLETLETLVNIDSGTGNSEGLTRIQDILVERLKALGAEVALRPAEPSASDNIVGRFRGRGHARILLMIHYDTVFGPDETEERPFRRAGGRLYGPGVADAKGSIALILHSLKLLRERRYDGYGLLTVLFNSDEEKGSLGSRDLIRELAADHDYVLSYEPPETDAVTIATNGINYLFLDVQGRASHAGSAPEQGRNAIIELAYQLLRLDDLGNPETGTTVNWTIVDGGERRNIIPASARAEGDMRYSDFNEIERVIIEANRLVEEHRVPDTTVKFRLQRGRPPLPSNPASRRLAMVAQEVYEATGRRLGMRRMRFGTDAGYAYRQGSDRPAVLETLGLVGASLHSPEEYAELNSVVPRLYLTVGLVMRLSGD
jgi:glutamate carboxypeptidase